MRPIQPTTPRRLCIFIATCALAWLPAAADTVPWKTLSASGPVSQQPDGDAGSDWSAVERGDLLEPLSLVRTGARGRVTLSRHASVLMIDPESQLQLPAGDARHVRQTSGSVIYDIEPGKADGFTVETPYLVAGVKGTVFGVTVTERYALVSVEEGLVEVRDADGERTLELRAGDAVMVDAFGRDLEMIRRGDARDRERTRTDRSRDRMHRRLQRNGDLADRRSDRSGAERDSGGDASRATAAKVGDDDTIADRDARVDLEDERDLGEELDGGLHDDPLDDPADDPLGDPADDDDTNLRGASPDELTIRQEENSGGGGR